MRSLDDYLTDIITRRIILSPTDEYFWAHGWMDTDFAMLMFFFEHEFHESHEYIIYSYNTTLIRTEYRK